MTKNNLCLTLVFIFFTYIKIIFGALVQDPDVIREVNVKNRSPSMTLTKTEKDKKDLNTCLHDSVHLIHMHFKIRAIYRINAVRQYTS